MQLIIFYQKITLSSVTTKAKNAEKDQDDNQNDANNSYSFDRVELKETNYFQVTIMYQYRIRVLLNLRQNQLWCGDLRDCRGLI